jgi:hypothetical protein
MGLGHRIGRSAGPEQGWKGYCLSEWDIRFAMSTISGRCVGGFMCI